jgi:hypothetical protein
MKDWLRQKAEQVLATAIKDGDCLIAKVRPNNRGYAHVTVNKTGLKFSAHGLVYNLVYGELPEGKTLIMHTCDRRNCVNPLHLKAGTAKENMQDMHNKGRHSRGRNTKTMRQEDRMLELLLAGYTQTAVGEEMGITQSAVAHRLRKLKHGEKQ